MDCDAVEVTVTFVLKRSYYAAEEIGSHVAQQCRQYGPEQTPMVGTRDVRWNQRTLQWEPIRDAS
jgi:hypothetical protein